MQSQITISGLLWLLPIVESIVENIEPIGLSEPPYRMAAERLYVDQMMPPVDMAHIKRISWMQVVRFDQDGFELKHEVDDSAVVTAALVMRGVDPDGMPPIECVVTSRPYPVDVVESLVAEHVLTGGRIYEPNLVMPPESLTAEHVLTGWTLRDILRSYDMGFESMTAEHVLTGGTLRDILRSYDRWPPEAFDITASLGDGELKRVLIAYELWPAEGLDITASISEGTLT